MRITTRSRRVRVDLSFDDAVNLHDILSSAWSAVELDRDHRRTLSKVFTRMERQIENIDRADEEYQSAERGHRSARKPKAKR